VTTAEPRTDTAARPPVTAGGLAVFLFLATFVLTIAILYWGQTVLIPVAFSLLLTFLLSPIIDRLERLRLGRIPSVIIVVILAFSLIGAAGWIVSLQLATLAGEIPHYQRNIKRKIVDLRALGKGGTFEHVQQTVEEIKGEMEKGEELAKTKERPREVVVQAERSSSFWPLPVIAGPLLERFASAGLAIVLVIFMLIEREDLRNRLVRLIGYGRITVTTRALEEAGDRISRYLLMQSIINGSFGLTVGFGLFLIGLPYAALWGFLAAVLRFIPYIGPWLAAIMPTALALAAFQGWLWPAAVGALFAVLELFTNMILEPLLYGDSAGVSQVALLVSVAFWTWLWGPLGLLMATPLTVCLVVLGKYVPQLEYITVLMSDQPVAESNIIYYQRLLALDSDEAAQIVREYVKTHPHDDVYDDVLLGALHFARLDRERDGLSEVQEEFLEQETKAILAKLDDMREEATPEGNAPTDEGTSSAPRVRILGCPARDEIDELALLMLQQLLHSTGYEIEVIGEEKLASEVIAEAGEKPTGLVCIGAVSPGGISHARYLCKRLRSEFPDLKIVVGVWGEKGGLEASRELLLATGADQVGATLLQTRDQIGNIAPLISSAVGFDEGSDDRGGTLSDIQREKSDVSTRSV